LIPLINDLLFCFYHLTHIISSPLAWRAEAQAALGGISLELDDVFLFFFHLFGCGRMPGREDTLA